MSLRIFIMHDIDDMVDLSDLDFEQLEEAIGQARLSLTEKFILSLQLLEDVMKIKEDEDNGRISIVTSLKRISKEGVAVRLLDDEAHERHELMRHACKIMR